MRADNFSTTVDFPSSPSAEPADPPGEREQGSSEKQETEDELVVSRYPDRKVDIEVVAAIVGVPRRHCRQRTAESVGHEDGHLNQNNADEHGRQSEPPDDPQQGNGGDAPDKGGPDDRVSDLDRPKRRAWVHANVINGFRMPSSFVFIMVKAFST